MSESDVCVLSKGICVSLHVMIHFFFSVESVVAESSQQKKLCRYSGSF